MRTAPNAICDKCNLEVWAGCEDVNCPTLLQEMKTMTDTTKIIELMPDMDTWPEWAIIARDNGSLFRECMEKIAILKETAFETARQYHVETEGSDFRIKELESHLEQWKEINGYDTPAEYLDP